MSPFKNWGTGMTAEQMRSFLRQVHADGFLSSEQLAKGLATIEGNRS